MQNLKLFCAVKKPTEWERLAKDIIANVIRFDPISPMPPPSEHFSPPSSLSLGNTHRPSREYVEKVTLA